MQQHIKVNIQNFNILRESLFKTYKKCNIILKLEIILNLTIIDSVIVAKFGFQVK